MKTKLIFIIPLIIIFAIAGFIISRPRISFTPSPNEAVVENKETPERATNQFACVGEYCDGHMSGDDYKDRLTTINVPLVRDGGNIGCGAEIFFAPHAVPKTTAVLDATYKLLFDIKSLPEIQTDGFRNTVGAYTKLFYDHVTLQNGVAKVYLIGDMYGPGHCAEPELRAQMTEAALQYPTVNRVEVYLNNKLYDWCAMDQSDGEGPCPENPKWWVAEKN